MMTEPEVFDPLLKSEANPTKRKRRFKIFENKPKPYESSIELQVSESNAIKQQSIPYQQQKKEVPRSQQVEICKIPQKTNLEIQFYGGDDEDDEFQLLEVKIDGCETVTSNKFGQTNLIKEMMTVPSVMFKNNEFIINEESTLYQSVKEIKDNYNGLQNSFQSIKDSIVDVDLTIRLIEDGTRESSSKLKDIQLFLENMRVQKEFYDNKIKEIDNRIENIEYMIELRSIRVTKQIKPRPKTENDQQEISVFIEEDGYKRQIDEDQDDFAESHYLPAGLITRYLQEREIEKKEQLAKKTQQALEKAKELDQQNKNLSIFHSIFKIGMHEYNCLIRFFLEEFPERTEQSVSFNLLFRRGTTDLQAESVGQKSDLQYKQNLLFIIKTSTGKRIGGFISNDLIQEETMEDHHAFLFTLEQQCHKFKVKEECASQAFMASKYYLITFSNDLMISSQCLQEQSYSEWPCSYAAKDEHSTTHWFVGDFQFMIEHIQVFQIVNSLQQPA